MKLSPPHSLTTDFQSLIKSLCLEQTWKYWIHFGTRLRSGWINLSCCDPSVSTTYGGSMSLWMQEYTGGEERGHRETDMKNFGFLCSLVSIPTISSSLSAIRQTFSAILPLTQEGVSHTRTCRPLNLLSDGSVPLCHNPKKERKIYVQSQKKEEGIYMSLCFVRHPLAEIQ